MRRRDLLTGAGTGAGAALLLGSQTAGLQKQGQRLILDLSGPWRLSMDDRNSGLNQRWFEREPAASEARRFDVTVPSVWQQYLELQGGIGWYYKDLDIPKELSGRFLRIRFEAVDYRARVWLNGHEAGAHDGGFTPFDVDVSQLAKAGTNRLAVRVSDVGRDFHAGYCGLPGWEKTTSQRVDGLTFSEIPAGFQDWREGFDHGGIWQPVSLIASDLVYLSDVFLVPNLAAGSVEARVALANRTRRAVEAQVTVEIRPWKGTAASVGGGSEHVRVEPGLNQLAIQVKLSRPRFWSIEEPSLYVAEASLGAGGQTLDDSAVRFGMREFKVGSDGAFYLNGKQFFVKGTHYQSTEPLTLAFPRNKEAARGIVEIAKEGGFNFIRGQGRPTVPAILDAADELGILFQCEPAVSKMPDNPNMESLAEREVTEMVQRDRNHPSVVIWNMINEQAAGMRVAPQMCQITRRLDPTRLITESAGGNSHYYLPGSADGISYLTEHYYPGAPLSEGMLEYFKTRGVAGQLYFVTEFGYGGLEDIDAVLEKYGPKPKKFMEDYQGFVRQKQDVEQAYQSAGINDLFPTLANLRDAAQSLQANAVRAHVEAMRSNPRLRGYNIVQLFDSNSNEVDGLIDFWRSKRKKSFAVMQELNRPLLLIVQCSPFNALVDQEVDVAVTLVNEDQISGPKALRIRILDPEGRAIFSEENSFDARPAVTRLYKKRVGLHVSPGRVTVEAETLDAGRTVLKKSASVNVYDPAAFHWPNHGVALFDPQNRWTFRRAAVRIRNFDAQQERCEIVIVPEFTALWRQPAHFQDFLHLVEQARRGSTLLFLGVPSDGSVPEQYRHIHFHLQFSPLTLASILGFRIDMVGGRGGWGRLVGPYGGAAGEASAGCPVMRHPVFEGCPGPGLMDWEYGNLATDKIVQPAIDPIDHTGPAIQILPFGSGRVVFCTLRLLDHLGRDALAEKLLSNLVGYLDRDLPRSLRRPSPGEEESFRFRLKQVQDCLDKFLHA